MTVLVESGIIHGDGMQLVDQHPPELELPGRAGAPGAAACRLGVHPHVAEEPLEQLRSESLRER